MADRPGSTAENMAQVIAKAMNVPTYRERFMALAGGTIEQKYLRNAFDFDGWPALLFRGAGFNHACRPNVVFATTKRRTMVFRTARDVKKGEELCDSYTTACRSKTDAHRRLWSQYGFVCDC